MTTFIMGHGNYSEPDTFVPTGSRIGIYAEVNTLLAITIGMAVLSTQGGFEPPTTFDATAGKTSTVHNYRIGPLTHPEYQRMRTVDSAKNTIIYIGFTEGFGNETQLCTDLKGCTGGRHQCDGILGRVHDTDIRLAFCLGKASESGQSKMTTTFPATGTYAEANAHLARYIDEAKVWFDRMTKTPDVAIPAFHKLASTAPGAREASFILASSKKLESLLVLHDARQFRGSLSAWDFLNYLYGLPEKSRAKVTKRLRQEPAPAAVPAPATALDRFVASYFTAGTAERRAGWAALTPQERTQATGNHLLKFWATHIVPVIDVYQQGWDSHDQPVGWFTGASFRSPLTEFGEAEAQLSPSYVDSFNACMAFGHTAGPAACLALWQRLDGNPDAQRLLSIVTGTKDPGAWKAQVTPDGVADPLAGWLADYRAAELAAVRRAQRTAAEQVPKAVVVASSSSSESEDIFATDPFADFWDDPDTENWRACRDWSKDKPVQVIELAGQFRFVERTTALAGAFPAAAWATFAVVDLSFSGGTLELKDGVVNLGAFRTYLARPAMTRLTTITVR
ncbi:putative adhesin [Streptomyces fildesensis]|uniref:Adhesin n=1 Tax=Streptomyces fildesensis TaxID=375757 RepID=A0ABW8CB33_9ACTN